MAPLKKALGDLFAKVEFVEADLLNPQSMEKAVEGCDFVVHTASPATINKPKHEDNLIKPAVEGTLAILKACDRYRVKRLVITSSIAAIYTQFPENMKETYSEADWSEVSLVSAYEKSKILAERAAWEFVHDLPLERRFELVTL